MTRVSIIVQAHEAMKRARNSFCLALLVMITFIQVNTSFYQTWNKLQYLSMFQTAI